MKNTYYIDGAQKGEWVFIRAFIECGGKEDDLWDLLDGIPFVGKGKQFRLEKGWVNND